MLGATLARLKAWIKTASLTPHPASEIGTMARSRAAGTSVNASNGETEMPRAAVRTNTMTIRPRWLAMLQADILNVVAALPKSV